MAIAATIAASTNNSPVRLKAALPLQS
jgi:hypothetical protein